MHNSTSRTCACRAAGLAVGVGMRCCPLGTTPRTLAPIHGCTVPPSAPVHRRTLFSPPLSSSSLLPFSFCISLVPAAAHCAGEPPWLCRRRKPPSAVLFRCAGAAHGASATASWGALAGEPSEQEAGGEHVNVHGAEACLGSRRQADGRSYYLAPHHRGLWRQARVAGRVVNRGGSPWKRRAGATSSKELQLGGGEDAWWDYPFTSGCTFPHPGRYEK